MTTSRKAVGHAVNRPDGRAKVTGQARYTGDFTLAGMLSGHCLRSPHPSARIVSIDTSEAKALPGVFAVMTGSDVPDLRYGRMCKDIPILCRDVVRFAGDKVAAVAAETPEIAERALSLIKVRYEERPAVFDARAAMDQAAPRVHARAADVAPGAATRLHGELRMYPPIPNVISQLLVRHGDADAAFAGCKHVFEHSFAIPAVHQGYIEPHTVVVAIGADAIVDIWLANKAPHVMRPMLAEATGVPADRLRFNPVFIGGDFGGKGSLMDAALCYYLARQAGRPVKMVMTATEELTAGNPRHRAHITLRTGLDERAQIVAMDAKMIFDAGAYAGFSPVATVHGYVAFAGNYRVPNCTLEVLRVYTNTVPAGHMRSPGGPQITFAVESHLDMVARELQLDPVDFRLRNAIEDGDLSPLGEARCDIRCRDVIEAGARAFNWSAVRPANVGRGLALYEYPPGTWGRSAVMLSVDGQARIRVTVGSPDTGTGAHSVIRQLVADHLQVPVDDVDVLQGDTLSTSFESGASGSRLTTTVGQAVEAAAMKARGDLRRLAAERLNCAPEDVEATQDGVYAAGGHAIGLKALMGWADTHGRAPLTCLGENTPQDFPDVTQFAAQFAEVEVDRDTGQVRVRHVVTAHDVGTIINPVTHQGQIEGGLVQAWGQAMCEHLAVENGLVVTAHHGEYKLPTVMDIPPLTTVQVPAPGRGPFDIKAIAEMSNVALPAAIANAIHDAVGVRAFELPIRAETIYWQLYEQQESRG